MPKRIRFPRSRTTTSSDVQSSKLTLRCGMKGFILGVVITLVVLFGGFYLTVSQGWFPVGADNPPGKLERKYANMAMDAYVEKHMPQGDNPMQLTSANLMTGASIYEKH